MTKSSKVPMENNIFDLNVLVFALKWLLVVGRRSPVHRRQIVENGGTNEGSIVENGGSIGGAFVKTLTSNSNMSGTIGDIQTFISCPRVDAHQKSEEDYRRICGQKGAGKKKQCNLAQGFPNII